MLKKAENTEADTAEQSALKLRAMQQSSNALVVTDHHPANGTPPVSQLPMVKVPSISSVVRFLSAGFYEHRIVLDNCFKFTKKLMVDVFGQDHNAADQGVTQENGTLSVVDPQPSEPSVDLLGDLLGPLAIEGPPPAATQSEDNSVSGVDGSSYVDEALALAPVGEQTNTIQVSVALLHVC